MADVSSKLSSHLASLMSSTNEDGLTFCGDDLLSAMKITLAIVHSVVQEKGDASVKDFPDTWSQFIPVFEKLVSASESNQHLLQQFEALLTNNTDALCTLLTCFATKNDQQWVCKLKKFTNFEVRYHLSRFMFPSGAGHDELEIDVARSNILEESFREVMKNDPADFLGGLSLFYEGEEALGEGVFRDWLCLVCYELVDPKRKLFKLTPDDERRISPNPSSAENHLNYFRFAGRIIGLALNHNIQTGVLLDHIFFKVLSGSAVCWEDLQESDHELYKSYKKLLEIDPKVFDESDGCGLVFTVDVTENSGEVRSHPLVPSGEDVAVTSTNRERYLELIFQHNCVTNVRDQTRSFSQGFEDMLSQGTSSSTFFSNFHLNDVDSMLRGSPQENICPNEWRTHTYLEGLDNNDDVINWFWQVVQEMTNEERRRLLFFWTAVNYLPRNGFHGLSQSPTIKKTNKGPDHLPESNTCFYRLKLPRYPSYEITKDKVLYVVDKNVSSSFGQL